MKITKNSFIITATAALLAGCGSTIIPSLSLPMEGQQAPAAKTAELTDAELKAWSSKDLQNDTIPGMGVDRTYREIIKDKVGTTVIVAVIDSGIDIEHEDLKNVMWVNPKEIAGNNIDDDKNGYVDDIHGWNFLGNIVKENMEYVRIVRKLKPKYDGKTEASVSAVDSAEFALYQKANQEFSNEIEQTTASASRYASMLGRLKPAHAAISEKLGKEDYSKQDLSGIENPEGEQKEHIAMLTQMLNYSDNIPSFIEQIQGGVDYFQGRLDSHFDTTTDFRGVVGDNPDDNSNPYYGNNDVDGPDPKKADAKHGTHVAGIIAAQRDNNIGMDGVAQNVQIMAVRAVPDGDEYDKDIANAIRYAVDNGAKVINTSFGKYYSTHPQWVWDALTYASENDVLIVNAAGNEGTDLDTIQVYPNDQVGVGAEISDTFLTVGALNYKYGSDLLATFSNYGKVNVDVFSPGVKIWATTPLDTYAFLQGTSMASPNVAGVAAMVRSYYPKLSAKQVKQILMDSGLSVKMEVVLGGDPENKNSFENISTSGKMVNMYNAFIMASKM
ncbi:S8 family peptidase [Flavobacteriaceae bacterium]|nr:S8 family peptidase [Flavobacteriaceae bacterium]